MQHIKDGNFTLDITKEDATKTEKNAIIAAHAAFNRHVKIKKIPKVYENAVLLGINQPDVELLLMLFMIINQI